MYPYYAAGPNRVVNTTGHPYALQHGYLGYWSYPYHRYYNPRYYGIRSSYAAQSMSLKDYGSKPFVFNINEATLQNNNFRKAIWTGDYLQMTLMSIGVGEDIGLEKHPNLDQFLRIEQGQGIVQMGEDKNNLNYEKNVFDDYAVFIPAGTWHNLTNTGNVPIKLYSIYAPPNHPFGTVHATKADAIAAEAEYDDLI